MLPDSMVIIFYVWFQQFVSRKHQGDKVIVFEKVINLVFVFNFHPTQSYTDYQIGVNTPGK